MRILYELTITDTFSDEGVIVTLNPNCNDQRKLTIKGGQSFLEWIAREALLQGEKYQPPSRF